jgi:hypothetical protein
MTYVATQDSLDRIAKVIYESKDGKTSKAFEALDWLARKFNLISEENKSFVPIRLAQVYPSVFLDEPICRYTACRIVASHLH